MALTSSAVGDSLPPMTAIKAILEAGGPARYGDVEQNKYKSNPPKYSMLARQFVPGDKTKIPGPGTHYPENVSINKQQMPKYSMGIRHSQYITPLLCEEYKS